jgi:hypothetical protein
MRRLQGGAIRWKRLVSRRRIRFRQLLILEHRKSQGFSDARQGKAEPLEKGQAHPFFAPVFCVLHRVHFSL